MRTGKFAALAPVALMAFAIGGSAAASEPATATIASATTAGFRAVVTATKTSGGAAPTASVSVTAFEKAGSKWRALGSAGVGRPKAFFWKVLTGSRSIREFAISTSSPQRVSVQLLITPALGWSPLYRFHVEHGTLVSG